MFLPILRKIKIIICWCGAGSMFQLFQLFHFSSSTPSHPLLLPPDFTALNSLLLRSPSLLVSGRSSEPLLTSAVSSPLLSINQNIIYHQARLRSQCLGWFSKVFIKTRDKIGWFYISTKLPFFLRSAEDENKRHFS